jgi:16S rRNA (cytidine1402-2'-O)-methyltransferase
LCSDPGYVVVERAVAEQFDVSPVPGPSSLLAVLSVAALPVDRFEYLGFLPRRAAPRQTQLRDLADRGVTFVCHEAPHRVHALLADLASVCPGWEVCVGREVTKVFEEFRRGRADVLASELSTEEPRGEFTLVVAPPASFEPAPPDEVDDRVIRALLEQGVTAKTIAAAFGSLPGASRKDAYARVLGVAGRR